MQKKRRKKKELTWNGGMQMRMHCVRMALCVDGIACGWCYMQMALRADALYGEVDGGSCRVGTDECKEKTKN